MVDESFYFQSVNSSHVMSIANADGNFMFSNFPYTRLHSQNLSRFFFLHMPHE